MTIQGRSVLGNTQQLVDQQTSAGGQKMGRISHGYRPATMVQGLSYATSPARQHRPHLSTQSFLTSVCVPGGVRPPLQVGYSLRVNYYTGRVVIDPFQPLNERRSYLSTSLNSTPRSTLARPTTHRQCVTYILVHQYHARAKFTVNIYLASWPRLLNTHPW